jgi:hypothetical protein
MGEIKYTLIIISQVLLCLAFLFLGGPSYLVSIVNDRQLEKQFQPLVLAATSLPRTKVVYRRFHIYSPPNGGGCLLDTKYIFSTELSQAEWVTANHTQNSIWKNSLQWIDREKFYRDSKYRKEFYWSAEEIKIIENLFATHKNVVWFSQFNMIDFGFFRNGLDPRCGNFD